MSNVNESPEVTRKKVIEIHASVNDYKAISKALGLWKHSESLSPNGKQ